MPDKEPRGTYLEFSQAATANLVFIFRAVAFRVTGEAQVRAGRRAATCASLAKVALITAFGQNLDVQNLSGEANYWETVWAEAAFCSGAALHIGALLGQASIEIADRVREFGRLFGEVVRIYGDLIDALKTPASPGWKQGQSNLAILYALTADHTDRAQFKALLP
jgi:geranylgeranyl pyrophosphate synthase